MTPDHHRQLLLAGARAAIRHGLQQDRIASVNLDDYPPALHKTQASFVTLKIRGQLRGCIGTLEAYRPLVIDVVENAHAAAFRDPRFAPLAADEYRLLSLHLSLLGIAESLSPSSEKQLLSVLRPGIDGLILDAGGRHRSTFLPAVWQSLPDPEDFLAQLRLKAGLPAGYWSSDIRFFRYTVEEISEAGH